MSTNAKETGMIEYTKGQGQRPAQASADNAMTPEHDGARKLVFQTPQIGSLEEEADGHTLSGSSGGQQWEMTPGIARDEAMETQAANWRSKEVMETFGYAIHNAGGSTPDADRPRLKREETIREIEKNCRTPRRNVESLEGTDGEDTEETLRRQKAKSQRKQDKERRPVAHTHLTLPTILLV